MTPHTAPLRVMILHRQRLLVEAMAAALEALAPDLDVSAMTGELAQEVPLPRVDVLLADPERIQARPRWTSPEGTGSVRYVAIGSVDGSDGVAQAVSALRAGASAWVPPMASPELLLHVIRLSVDGDLWVPPELVSSILLRLIGPPRTPAGGPDLSSRERTILELVSAGRTNREIAAELHLSANTIRSHRQRLFRKIDAHSGAQAAAWLRQARTATPSVPQPRLRWDGPRPPPAD